MLSPTRRPVKAPETKLPVFSEAWWRKLKEVLDGVGALDTLSEAQRREIKESLAELGLDLDDRAFWRAVKESLAELRGIDLDAETVEEPPAVGTFSESQWQEIKESLAERGVDLDAETVDEPGPREWFGWDDYNPSQVPLGKVLQEFAHWAAMFRGMRLRTPKQAAGKLRDKVAALENALAMVNPTDIGPGFATDDELEARINRRHALRAAMMVEIAEWRKYIAKLEAEGSSSKHNARTASSEYWSILAKLWLKVTGSAGSKRRQHLRRFLLACTAPDLFPEIAQQLEQKVDSFISNFFKTR
jgi:hypothetical protein